MAHDLNWDALHAGCVDFARRLIQTPSMSGEEAAVAALIAAEMRRLAFDDVWLDPAGNVFGRIHGADRAAGALVLNAHTDHVDPGDLSLWPTPPYAAEIVADHIVGRGAADIKGPLAVQVYAMAALRRMGVRPRRDVVFCGVVHEETGGAGVRYWAEHVDYPVALVVLAEPSENTLAIGHRGIYQIGVTFHGQSAHASAPERAVNPNYALAAFLTRLAERQHSLKSHPVLGPTTVSPTIVEVDTKSRNVTPAWTRVTLDFRTAAESVAGLEAFIRELAGEHPMSLQEGSCHEPTESAALGGAVSGFYTPPDSDVVTSARALLAQGLGHEPPFSSYLFATDGRHLTSARMPIIGFAPGSEKQAHVAGEKIPLAEMAAALRAYVVLLQNF